MKPTVVVGYDQSPAAERALLEAGREAAWRSAAVQVVHTFHWIPAASPMVPTPVRLDPALRDAADEIAEQGAETLRTRYPGMSVTAVAAAGLPADILATAAAEADLLVVGRRGRGGFPGLRVGSVALRTLARTPCPVLVVGDTGYPARDLVVAGIDLADPSDPTLDFAFAEASARSVPLRVLTAWDAPGFRTYTGDTPEARETAEAVTTDASNRLEEVIRPWQARYPEVRVVPRVVAVGAAQALLEASTLADVMVVGAHRYGSGRDGVRIGPVADTLLQHADCPVVVVPRD